MALTKFEEAGLRRYRAKIDAMPREVKDAIRRALVKGGDDLTKTMRQLAPVDEGELRDTVEYYFPERRPSEPSYRGEQLSIKAEAGLAIVVVAGSSSQSGEDGFYSKWTEFGHQKADGSGQVVASPFFYPAYRLRRGSIRSRITREMRKALTAVSNGGR